MPPIIKADYSLNEIDELTTRKYIIIKNARVNNLKGLTVAIPRNKLVVITGLSGSGKSSLAFDTLFAEGQRMYVESLSSYARQFLGRMEKPQVDYIKGVSPAIAIEQKINTRNPRSTVGTTTEIYDYLKLLYARIGATYSPISGQMVRKDTTTDASNYINEHPESTKIQILCPLIPHEDRSLETEFNILLSKGYTRILVNGEMKFIEDILPKTKHIKIEEVMVLIDRVIVNQGNENNNYRISDSIQTAFFEGMGKCTVNVAGKSEKSFSDRFELDGILFEESSINLFSFNNPFGACKTCEGLGKVLGIDEDLVIPDKSLSVYEGAIAPWSSQNTWDNWLSPLIQNSAHFNFPIHRPISDLSEKEYTLLWEGNKYYEGIMAFFKYVESKTHNIRYRVLLSRYRSRTICRDCRGTRLRKDAGYVKINGKSIIDLVLMSIEDLSKFFAKIELSEYETKVAGRLLKEIKNRLGYLNQVGLGYLTLNRSSSTLSGGEFQRIKLATSLGSALVGSMYVLDEPSIGLHPKDTQRLISVLKHLCHLGNTVIVVEHEEDIMRAADQIIDIGPDAGSYGGELVYQGNINQLDVSINTHTARYLFGSDQIEIPLQRRKWKNAIHIEGARENNLQNVSVKIPMEVLTVITGVSGSGKSTLIKNILYPAVGKILGTVTQRVGRHNKVKIDGAKINQIEFVDQNPIGKSSRSNPVTYVKAYDAIRQLFTERPLAKQRAYKPAQFSFNVEGGRCEACQGEGQVKIEMQFMADIHLTCESCKGKRFKQETLDVTFKEKNIAHVLEMTVDDSIKFFQDKAAILNKLKPLQRVGLGYVRLGQSSNSLSGGEAQRVKLASFLGKESTDRNNHILFIFDEPTTGLHFHDIKNLLVSINALIENGNSVLVIEHNAEVIKTADWVIDLGPGGGTRGGRVIFEGTPEELAQAEGNYTGIHLKNKMHLARLTEG